MAERTAIRRKQQNRINGTEEKSYISTSSRISTPSRDQHHLLMKTLGILLYTSYTFEYFTVLLLLSKTLYNNSIILMQINKSDTYLYKI